jgi:hypothetical protein
MTELFERAVAEVSKRTVIQQNMIAAMILEELADEEQWENTFARSQNQLAKLADKVREDFKMGRVKKMGFDEL